MWSNLLQWVVAHQTKPVDDYDYKVYIVISNKTCVVYWCNKRFPSFSFDSIWITRDGIIQTNRARVIHQGQS